MKLTKHQEQIVDKIIDGTVYDITTYLKEFEKGRNQKYNLVELRKTFETVEKDKRYYLDEEDGNYYTLIQDGNGKIKSRDIILQELTWKYREYNLDKPVKAVLNEKIRKKHIEYHGEKHSFDFKEGVFVADSFEDVKDFIALWCYLKHEALIFDVKKTVSNEDLGIFFELIPHEIEKNSKPEWNPKIVVDYVGEYTNDVGSHYVLAPYKRVEDYMESEWKHNDENMKACEEFLDRKILSTGALRVYQQKGYKTVEELSVKANLELAKLAVVIAVISVIMGNIIPLFQKQDTDYLEEISKRLYVIENKMEDNTDKVPK